jgi:hypothetical protein
MVSVILGEVLLTADDQITDPSIAAQIDRAGAWPGTSSQTATRGLSGQ